MGIDDITGLVKVRHSMTLLYRLSFVDQSSVLSLWMCFALLQRNRGALAYAWSCSGLSIGILGRASTQVWGYNDLHKGTFATTPLDVCTQVLMQVLSQFSMQGDEQATLVRHCLDDLGCQPLRQYSFRDGCCREKDHQLNSTYLSALQSDDQAYLLVLPPPFSPPFHPKF